MCYSLCPVHALLKMMYRKMSRRKHTRPGARPNLLPALSFPSVVKSGCMLLAIVLTSGMVLLLSTHYRTDSIDCPCAALVAREVTNNQAVHALGVQTSTKLAVVKGPNGAQTSTKLEALKVTGLRKTNQAIQPTPIPNKFLPKWWKNHTRTVCKALGMRTNLSAMEPEMLSKVLVDDVHKILYCQIAKVASTNLGKIFAIIAGKFNGTNPDAIDSNDIHWKYNKLQSHLDSFPVNAIISMLNHYYKFVFVRDPFERLLSGYRNKFLKPSSSYFSYLNRKLVLKYRTNATQTGGVTFTEFVSYLVDPERKAPMNGHWQPMYELCLPCETNYDFVGKINTFGEDVSHILEVNKLTDVIEVPRQSSSHSFHKTDLYLEQYFSQVPKPLLLSLYKTYYPDYAIFDFQVPEVIMKMMI